jgi:predicted TIM-barrel fold metal-dependent hydrolase
LIIDAYCTLGEDQDEKLAADDLLRLMDENGIERAVIVPASREMAVANREGNARLAQIARRHAPRLIPAFCVNPWFGVQALDWAEEAVHAGGRMLVLAPHRQGHHLGDPVAEKLVAWACDRSIPIYAHAAPTSSGTPAQLFFLADRFPKGRFLLGRCGTTDYAYDMAPILQAAPANLWYDSGFVRPSAFARYAAAAPDRFCFASCAPQNDFGFEWTMLRDLLPYDQFSAIHGDNFQRFLEP